VVTHLAKHSEFQHVAVRVEGGEGVIPLIESQGFRPFTEEENWARLKGILSEQAWAPVPDDGLEGAEWMLPIRRESTFYGIMLLGGKLSPGTPTEEDRILFVSITSQMAIALENIAYIHQSNEMIEKLTQAKVREEYLTELEKSNQRLDEKNRELTRLYDELKQTETQLIQTEKMASLGQLVAGIAHELNNPIGFIYANIRQLKTYLEPIQKAARCKDKETVALQDILQDLEGLIEDTVRGSQAVKALVNNLRTFSHLDQAEMTETNVHDGLETSLIIARPQLKDRITVVKDFQADGRIEAYPGQLNQLFLNLIVNAAQAIEGEGIITIKTSNEADKLVIQIADTGPGIPEEVRSKIFDPFFSTKEIGEGMGMGLSISYAIVEKHKGEIGVDSVDGEGTRFTITLPRASVTS
jgi:signal transduction histidine kinase